VTTIRDVTRSPIHYANRPVTVSGRFGGRRGPGPESPTWPPLKKSRWDFLLTSDDAAVWVSGLRPAGWDFDLDPRSLADSSRGHWLRVTGTLRVSDPARAACAPGGPCERVWIEASDLRPGVPATASTPPALLRPPLLAPSVVFHDPISEEMGVSRTATVRLQFSRHMIAETFSEHVRISYTSPRSLSSAPVPAFTAAYHVTTRSLEVRFATPLDSYRTVRVELLDGISAISGLPLAPWSYTFTTGD
jgi:hypothetical protein